MSLKTWENGDKGEDVKRIIESNFKVVGSHLSHNMLALTTDERNKLGGDYLSEGLLVFDTSLGEWFRYNNGGWEKSLKFVLDFTEEDWIDNVISIPYSLHHITSPCVQIYILSNNVYEAVIGGVSIDNDGNVVLCADFTFSGRVVIT